MDVLEKPLIVLNTIEKGDVGISKGSLAIPGVAPIRLNDINSIDVIHSRAEQAKVYTLGASNPTLIANETYKLSVRVERVGNQGWERPKRDYYAVVMSDVSNMATARADLYQKFVDRINADIEIPVTAEISGTNLVITDRGGYFLKGSGGESNIRVIKNSKGIGFADSDLVVTKNAVYGTGIGSELVKKQVLIDPIIGNAYNSKPYYASLSQVESTSKYTSIVINSVVSGNGINMLAESLVMKWVVQIILVKEGTAGIEDLLSVVGEAAIQKLSNDSPSMMASGLYSPINGAGIDGSAAAATDKKANILKIGESLMYSVNVGANTLFPVLYDVKKGYKLDGDLIATEGREISTNPSLDGPSFVVGKGAFSISARLQIGTLSEGVVAIGFRKKGDTAQLATYTQYAAVGTISADENIKTSANLAATSYVKDTGLDVTAATMVELGIVIFSDGSAKAFVDGQEFVVESANGVALKIAAGTELLGFIHCVSSATTAQNAYVKSFSCTPFDQAKTKGGILKT